MEKKIIVHLWVSMIPRAKKIRRNINKNIEHEILRNLKII